MLKIRNRQTVRKKIRLEQKNKTKSSLKLMRLHSDLQLGTVSIYAEQSINTCERTIMNLYTGFKRYLKKRSIVWLRPVQIKTTTTKGEKRLGKGKGGVVTYNRTVPIKAGKLLLELGFVTQMSPRNPVNLLQIIRSLVLKLPFSVKVKVMKGISSPLLTRRNSIDYTPFK